LESLVEERTSELNKANRKLKNRTKKLETALKHLKQTQNQLVQAEKMASLGVLSAGVAHEINNPLNFIKNGIEGVDEILKSTDGLEYNDVEPFIIAIQEGALRASNIVKSLGHFSRQDDQLVDSCDVHRVLENCLTILRSKFRDKVELTRKYSGEKIIVTGNDGKLHQIFLNVLSNAEEAINGKGNIEISTRMNEKRAEITISDDGEGIPRKILKKISDPFFTTKPVGEGTGLGLSITYALVKEHGGNIEFESEVGRGTKVIITFPIDNKL
jgi:C4-dicarboxylate-specific signal transduction histidine kinase